VAGCLLRIKKRKRVSRYKAARTMKKGNTNVLRGEERSFWLFSNSTMSFLLASDREEKIQFCGGKKARRNPETKKNFTRKQTRGYRFQVAWCFSKSSSIREKKREERRKNRKVGICQGKIGKTLL